MKTNLSTFPDIVDPQIGDPYTRLTLAWQWKENFTEELEQYRKLSHKYASGTHVEKLIKEILGE